MSVHESQQQDRRSLRSSKFQRLPNKMLTPAACDADSSETLHDTADRSRVMSAPPPTDVPEGVLVTLMVSRRGAVDKGTTPGLKQTIAAMAFNEDMFQDSHAHTHVITASDKNQQQQRSTVPPETTVTECATPYPVPAPATRRTFLPPSSRMLDMPNGDLVMMPRHMARGSHTRTFSTTNKPWASWPEYRASASRLPEDDFSGAYPPPRFNSQALDPLSQNTGAARVMLAGPAPHQNAASTCPAQVARPMPAAPSAAPAQRRPTHRVHAAAGTTVPAVAQQEVHNLSAMPSAPSCGPVAAGFVNRPSRLSAASGWASSQVATQHLDQGSRSGAQPYSTASGGGNQSSGDWQQAQTNAVVRVQHAQSDGGVLQRVGPAARLLTSGTGGLPQAAAASTAMHEGGYREVLEPQRQGAAAMGLLGEAQAAAGGAPPMAGRSTGASSSRHAPAGTPAAMLHAAGLAYYAGTDSTDCGLTEHPQLHRMSHEGCAIDVAPAPAEPRQQQQQQPQQQQHHQPLSATAGGPLMDNNGRHLAPARDTTRLQSLWRRVCRALTPRCLTGC